MKISYTEQADVLTVEDEEYADFDRSLDLGDTTIDLDTRGDCLGLIIEGAAERTGLEPETLETVSDVDVSVEGDGDALRITAVLHHDDGTTTVTGGRRERTEKVKGQDI